MTKTELNVDLHNDVLHHCAQLADDVGHVPATALFPIFDDESLLFARLLQNTPSIFEDVHVVDAGCGSGILGLTCAAMGAGSTLLFDVSAEATSHVRRGATTLLTEQKVEVVTRDWSLMSPIAAPAVWLCNPPFVPAPVGAYLPRTSYGGPLGVSELAHVIQLISQGPPNSELLLLSLSLVTSKGESLVEYLLRTHLGNCGSITSAPIYPSQLPIQDYFRIFEGTLDFQSWQSSVLAHDCTALDYRLYVVSNRFNAAALLAEMPSKIPHTNYSGNWEGRLNRYKTWMKVHKS